MMERERRLLVRVGFFVSLGLALLMAFVFILSGEQGIFSRQNRYSASFQSIDGLKPGSPVRLAGVQVGTVTSIRFFDDPSDPRVRVEMNVLAKYADRIRENSTASVGSLGVLGDKVIDLSLGTPDRPVIPPGGEIPASTGSDYTALIQKGAAVIDNTLAITEDLREVVATFNSPELQQSVAGLSTALKDILEGIRDRDGVLHALIFDPAGGRKTREILDSTAMLARRLDSSMARVDSLLARVDRGEGLVGALFATKEGEQVVHDLGKLARELGALAEAVRTEEDSLLHGLFYGSEDTASLGRELTAAARDLRAIISRVEQGEGSLGALINDPTVYDDLKTILGNVKRNRILRALVRYSISNRDEIEAYGQRE